MKLGKQTASIFNHLMSTKSESAPRTDKGATVLNWTDRHAYFVNEVSVDGKRVIIERAKAVRTDGDGMSDSQSYRYERKSNFTTKTIVFKWGKWREEYMCPYEEKIKYQPINIIWDGMFEYYDYSF